MLCRTCDYPLWNLTARQCPECGTPFLPGEYEFKVGFVRFNCPHCAQSYYGTDEKGHLEPREFDCVACGRPVSMDQMVLLPSEGVEDEQTRLRDPLPWLVRKEMGFLRGWLKTVFGGMGAPARLARSLPPESPKGQAWWFAALTLMVCALVASLPFFVMMATAGGMSRGRMFSGFGAGVMVGAAAQLAWLVVWGLSVHACLRVLGVSHARLGRTFEYVCYTCGPCAIIMIPCLGLYMFWIGDLWWAIAAAAMITVGYGIKGWKAALAALLLPTLAAGGLGALITYAILGAAQLSSSWTPPNPGPAQLAAAVQNYAAAGAGSGQVHSAELVASGELTESELIAPDSQSSAGTVRIGSTTLDVFLSLDPDQQVATAESASASLPAGVVAHRLGDVVFTYHGVNEKSTLQQGIWMFIVWPDPDANPGPPQNLTVGLPDGTTRSYPAVTMASLLQSQNALRRAVGLPVLPDPSTVTHDAPAVGEAGVPDGG